MQAGCGDAGRFVTINVTGPGTCQSDVGWVCDMMPCEAHGAWRPASATTATRTTGPGPAAPLAVATGSYGSVSGSSSPGSGCSIAGRSRCPSLGRSTEHSIAASSRPPWSAAQPVPALATAGKPAAAPCGRRQEMSTSCTSSKPGSSAAVRRRKRTHRAAPDGYPLIRFKRTLEGALGGRHVAPELAAAKARLPSCTK